MVKANQVNCPSASFLQTFPSHNSIFCLIFYNCEFIEWCNDTSHVSVEKLDIIILYDFEKVKVLKFYLFQQKNRVYIKQYICIVQFGYYFGKLKTFLYCKFEADCGFNALKSIVVFQLMRAFQCLIRPIKRVHWHSKTAIGFKIINSVCIFKILHQNLWIILNIKFTFRFFVESALV